MTEQAETSKVSELVRWAKSDRAWPVLAGFAVGVFIGVLLRD